MTGRHVMTGRHAALLLFHFCTLKGVTGGFAGSIPLIKKTAFFQAGKVCVARAFGRHMMPSFYYIDIAMPFCEGVSL